MTIIDRQIEIERIEAEEEAAYVEWMLAALAQGK